tara:strand:+ start:510 stop:1064 length:555 start_codon:yes stop_codon:yes gene_type:complete
VCGEPIAHLDRSQKAMHMTAHQLMEGGGNPQIQRNYEELVASPSETPINPTATPMQRAMETLRRPSPNLPKVQTPYWNPIKINKAPRIPRKKGQPAGSKKHSDLYTDENPKGTIHGLGFKNPAKARQSVSKIKNSSRSHAHKTQAAIAMEQRAREMGKTSEASIYRNFIEQQKKKTKAMKKMFR